MVLSIPSMTVLALSWLIAITIAVFLYLIIFAAIVTVLQGVKWVLEDEKKKNG